MQVVLDPFIKVYFNEYEKEKWGKSDWSISSNT